MSYDLKPSPFAPEKFPDLPEIAGLRLFTTHSGLKYQGRDDLLFVALEEGATAAGVFTQSATAAAPVHWCRAALQQGQGRARALVVNAGNANAFTCQHGEDTTRSTAEAAAREVNAAPEEVQVCSTGVIGERFDAEVLTRHFPAMLAGQPATWEAAARAIMTTDTYPKGAAEQGRIGANTFHVAGIAKGSGMIAPNMATMLAFVFTDAAVPADLLQRLLAKAVDTTFNCITVDGDTSTNDTVLAFATGKGGAVVEADDEAAVAAFAEALHAVCHDLALQIVKDGEGATKFVQLEVDGAPDDAAAKQIAMSVANSPLVKTAVAGEDPNWGRIVAAVGKSGVNIDQRDLRIFIGCHLVAEKGAVAPGYDEARAAQLMRKPEIYFTIEVGSGPGRATVWTCDLTHAYIDINADYRS